MILLCDIEGFTYEEIASNATATVAASNVVVVGGTSSIGDAAAWLGGQASMDAVGQGLIVVSDGSHTYVYMSADLGDAGATTLLVTLTGVADATTLAAANFVTV